MSSTPLDRMAAAIKELESLARDLPPGADKVAMSVAISLKRIADALDDIVHNGAPINVDHRPR